MNAQHSTLFVPAPAERIRAVLLDPLALPDWNRAFDSIGGPEHAVVGTDYRINVRGRTGTWRYTSITPDRIDADWRIPGLRETGSWILRPGPTGTSVVHTFQHAGPLAVALRHAFQGVADLRLHRLAERCGAVAGSGRESGFRSAVRG